MRNKQLIPSLFLLLFLVLEAGLASAQTPTDGKGTVGTAQASVASKGLQGVSKAEIKCVDGFAAQFPCEGVGLYSLMTLDELGPGDIQPLLANDIWGWTDPETGSEYALVGRNVGTAFVDVTDPTNPVLIGDLPRTPGARATVWRDIKVYQNYAFIVSDGAGDHGMQVFDLTRLRDVSNPPAQFEADALYREIGSAHNVVINEESGFAYVVGASVSGLRTCGGGLHMVDIHNSLNPTAAGCFADPSTGFRGSGYTHDAECVIYRGPDSRYQGREICFGLNENGVSIADVTDKENPVAISVGRYPDFGYVHQGWLTADQQFLLVDDELDERTYGRPTETKIFDVADLESPIVVASFENKTNSIDHNLYVKGTLGFQANYTSGLRILDVRDPLNIEEIGYFDTTPGDSAVVYGGTWSVYPFFESGTLVVSSMNEGLFVLESEANTPEVPDHTGVSEVWPNPFNATTHVSVSLLEPENVSIAIYDPTGRLVSTLHQGELAGNRVHQFTWESGSNASGTYLIRIVGETFQQVRSVTLLK